MARIPGTMLALACLVSTVSTHSIPSDAVKPLAVGFAEGFVSDGPELLMCGQLALGEAASFEQALKDLKTGITSFNLTKIEAAVMEVKDDIAAIPTAEKTCKTVVSDLGNIVTSLKKIVGPKDLVLNIVDHLFDDSEKIFGELAAAEHAYKTGWDYMTAGQQVGMSVRRLFIGEGGASPVPAPAPAGAKKELFEGVAVGFISDSLDFMNCSIDIRSDTGDFDKAMNDFEFGIRHFNLTDIKDAVQEFEMIVQGAAGTKATCKAAVAAVGNDVNVIVAALKQINGPKDLVLKVIDNFFSQAEDIFAELSSASKAYRTAEYIGSGRQLGMALRRMLVGEPNSTNIQLFYAPNLIV